ncbi:aminoacyl-tRNA hydrolase [Succinatimonas hippei]|uniref:Peptidyl-tRNA hydrolase n=1 Tax=Succinatimonas hippei (strain DSM 22608 / JCM 16073 / KCTC 15190 / YIT 12066) TaxID=762983 RepID=E8LHT9_SUCHY|nr:aminoacyl-tRNA hydrolase [Succinatimonas hippei]EFY07911.1 aminoacyl-tRNA hydrolase [Succinatimonas hippei YIT 12066]
MPNNVNLKLIVGLGNIGPKYEHTRHNMGCDLLFNIADKYRINLNPESKFSGLVGRGSIEGKEVRLVFPTTFMNESGRSVGALCNFFRIAPEEILVLHDDLDLPPGTIRFKFGGGLAGHNGLKSITACLSGAQNYYRLRIGIGHPERSDVINWVLNRPAPQDRDKIDAALDAALLGIGTLFKDGVNKATSFINGFKPL